MFTKFIWIVLCLIDSISCAMEPYVVGGKYTNIVRFPHSTFLTTTCVYKNNVKKYWICGGSIINQDIVLTAAHCLSGCGPGSHIAVSVGHENRHKGVLSSAHSYVIHQHYDSSKMSHDIALLRLKTRLSFNARVRRVALMKNPPYYEGAAMAGWGLIDETKELTSDLLKYTDQEVWRHEKCKERIRSIPKGCICASSKKRMNFASRGDSGSALMVRDYIQIGLVSFKIPDIAKNLIIYTDVGYYHDWINDNMKRMYCTGNSILL